MNTKVVAYSACGQICLPCGQIKCITCIQCMRFYYMCLNFNTYMLPIN